MYFAVVGSTTSHLVFTGFSWFHLHRKASSGRPHASATAWTTHTVALNFVVVVVLITDIISKEKIKPRQCQRSVDVNLRPDWQSSLTVRCHRSPITLLQLTTRQIRAHCLIIFLLCFVRIPFRSPLFKPCRMSHIHRSVVCSSVPWVRNVTQAQQRPESPTVTLIRHACKVQST